MSESRESGDGLTPLCEGNPLARELARLVPSPPGFERDALLFAAGAAARAGTMARWRWATAAAVCVAAGAWGYVLSEPGPETRGEPVAQNPPDTDHAPKPPTPAPQPTEPPAGPFVVSLPLDEIDLGDRVRALRLRNDILAGGLGLIPSAARPEATARSTWAELEQSLGLPAGTFAVPMKEKPKSDGPD